MSAPTPPWSGEPAGSRRPLISTNVRFVPRLRRFRVAVPVALLDMLAFCVENTCGRMRNVSSTRTLP